MLIKIERENNKLITYRNRIENTYNHILREQGVISAELLKNTIIGVNSIPTMLLQAGDVEREHLRLRSIEINSTTSYRQSGISQRNLKEFLCSRGMKDIAFSDITEEFGESFKLYLKTIGERRAGYINKCITWLNRLIYIAIDQEVLRSNPLEEVRYEKKEPPKHKHISKDDLKRLLKTPMPEERLELVRRAFIFSTLTGLAYVDIYGLYIRKRRVKTNVEAFIPLHPIAEQILMLYNTTDDSFPVFPLPVRDKIWYEINQIGTLINLKENLSYHQSRHSFGTLLLSAGVSIESVAKMMGHANINTTQVYAQITEQKISQDMDKLIERRKTMQNTANQTAITI